MKNATKHAEDLRNLFKRLMKDSKPEPNVPADPLRALVRGAMCYDMPDSRADDAMKAIETEFVDLNELRVATDLEIHELLGVKYPAIEKRVAMITQSLNAIFEKEHTLSLERLRALPKRDARQFLRDLAPLHPFVDAYVMLMSFEGHAIPVDDQTVAFLRQHGVIEDGSTLDDTQKFLEHAMKADECFDFFTCVRRSVQSEESTKMRKKAKA